MNFKKYILKDLLEYYEREYYGTLDESGAGLSRVLSKLEENIDFLFITASRGNFSKSENKQRNNELIKSIRSEIGEKIGAYKIVGHWKECSIPLKDGETIQDCKGSIENSLEETWLFTKPDNISSEEFDKIAQKNARKYDQDSYVIRSNGKLELKGKDGSSWVDLGIASKQSLSTGFEKIVNVQGYSELAKLRSKGRTANIIFEEIYLAVPKNNNSSKSLFKNSNILF